MTDLTREQIGEWREMLVDPAPWASEAQRVRAINTLCDMALRSLAVPEGCVVVPMELTKEMLDAAAALPSFRLINDWLAEMQIARGRAVNWTTDDPPLKQAWRAMLSAAPPAAAGWVSVKDRLPMGCWSDGITHISQSVLVATWGGVGGAAYDRRKNQWFSGGAEGCKDYHPFDPQSAVTHWMPLPSPPREKGSP